MTNFKFGFSHLLALMVSMILTASALLAEGSDILLVLDNSGSMRKNDPQNMMRDVVNRFARQLPAESRLGIVIFGKGANLVLPLSSVRQSDFQARLDESLRKIDYSSALTDTPAGVERAIYELRENSHPGTKRVIILFTDGIVDVGNAEKVIERERWLRSNLTITARQLGIRIFAIAFTEEADFQLMQSVAQATDAEYFRILRDLDIEGVFNQLSVRLSPPAHGPAPPPVNSAPVPGSQRGLSFFVFVLAGLLLVSVLFWRKRRRLTPPIAAAPAVNLDFEPENEPVPVKLEKSASPNSIPQEIIPPPALPSPAPPMPKPEVLLPKFQAPTLPTSSPLMCSKHPLWKATETCPECQQKKCKNCMTERNGRTLCADCAKMLNNR